MLNSMTGFGKATGTHEGKKVSIEIRSLNSKSMDMNVRMAPKYKELEAELRKLVAKSLERGKVDFNLNLDSIGSEKSTSINHELAQSYHNDLKQLNEAMGNETEDYLSLILRMPDIYMTDRQELSEEEKSWIFQLTEEALGNLNEFRRREGKELEEEFETRIGQIRDLLTQIPQYEQQRIEVIRERMKKGLEEIAAGSYDTNRFEQEMIFYLEKLDVSEEKMRLQNHLDYFIETMNSSGSGKKLGFISQEIGREINTLGSKSNHAEMQVLVIGMKDSLEKIKEQILNTL